MAHRKTSKRSKAKAKTILRLPDLEQSKTAVLHSLAAASSQESYGHAIDEFIGWYCSEPRLAFNRTVVLRYRFFLEQRNLAPSTINVRPAAVQRLDYEASDTGLLSPDLAAGIRWDSDSFLPAVTTPRYVHPECTNSGLDPRSQLHPYNDDGCGAGVQAAPTLDTSEDGKRSSTRTSYANINALFGASTFNGTRTGRQCSR